ncbi:VENN motif pre-toxin domain-containing protein [Gallibacterium anatis]|nr:VENN motif pre-toxin domain-containing protein [Gallibacterium anatis]WIM83304.1 VENN motif pre-toxin domain-containing protein [Gallibacterium anatis]
MEAYATGNNATAGAAGAVGGEVAAKIITEQLYQKTPEQLTEAQKQTVTALSQLASGLAGGLISDSTTGAINAAEIGKRAVEDNYLFNIPFTNPSLISDLNNKTIAEQLQKEAEEKAKQEIIDRGIPHYVLIEGTLYKYSGKLAINTRNGDIFYGFGANPISIPASGLSASTQIGWIVNLESKELNNNLKNVINNTLQGSSIGGTVCYGICSSFSRTIQTDKPKNLFGIGVGGRLSIGGDRLYQLDEDK